MDLLPKPTDKSHKLLLEYYDDKLHGKLTQAQLEDACNYWVIEYAFDQLRHIPTPSCPWELTKWSKLSDKQRNVADEAVKSRMIDLGKGFWDMYDKIVNQNNAMFNQLIGVLATLKKYGNKTAIVEERINDFRSKGVRGVVCAK
jgi:hypothetical protein